MAHVYVLEIFGKIHVPMAGGRCQVIVRFRIPRENKTTIEMMNKELSLFKPLICLLTISFTTFSSLFTVFYRPCKHRYTECVVMISIHVGLNS